MEVPNTSRTLHDDRWTVDWDPPRRRDTKASRRKVARLRMLIERIEEGRSRELGEFDLAALNVAVRIFQSWIDHDPWWERDTDGNWSLTDYAIRRQFDYAKRQSQIVGVE